LIRLYAWALRLLPREFREQFGDALLNEAVCLSFRGSRIVGVGSGS
jgi:hypothetical protein